MKNPFASIETTKPEPTAEDFEREKRADKITYDDLVGQFNCSATEAAAIIQRSDFPTAYKKLRGFRTVLTFSRRQVQRYLDAEHARVAMLPKVLK